MKDYSENADSNLAGKLGFRQEETLPFSNLDDRFCTCGIGSTDDTLWWTGVNRGFSVYKCVFLSLQNAIWTDDMGKRKMEKDSGRKNPAVFLFLWNEKEN